MADFVGAIDQGTTSTRCIIFDHDGLEVARKQLEHDQILPRPGWVEHDPAQILQRTHEVVLGALATAGLAPDDLVAIGVTNQRETTVVWDPVTGKPYLNAIVWQDTRSAQLVSALARAGKGDFVRQRSGLPLATYFSAGKLRWILDNVEGARAAAARGRAVFGTIDSWLIWNLTGGPRGGRHVTDVTNASRSQLLGLRELSWDQELLDLFDIPLEMLPEVRPSSGPVGVARFGDDAGPGILVAAALGDQHAAMIGQLCTRTGEAKNTYGTGNFLLVNTGPEPVWSEHGLLTTVCYQMEGQRPTYALEGSIAVTGAAVQWLRDQIGLIGSAGEIEGLASAVDDNGGVYFVPAFSGLFAPYWDAAARGTVVGLTRATTKAHLARATLEAICYQTKDVVLAMEQGTGTQMESLRVDGGVTANSLCMQLQADILGIPVSKPAISETTALGAAFAAGCATGFWSGFEELRSLWHEGRRWEPTWGAAEREEAYRSWRKAVERSLGWEDGQA